MKSIDLHGTRHKDVESIIEKACSKLDIPFMVITGNSPTMKREVSKACRIFGLSVRDVINNPGRVIVYEAS